MKRPYLFVLAAAAASSASPLLLGQVVRSSEPVAGSDVLSRISMFSYLEGPKSDLSLRGTPIAPNAEGEAEVEYEDGNARISAKVDGLPPPASLGPYTTYVLWTLTPDSRGSNQGVLSGYAGGKGELETTYASSQFAVIITAEPHFAVSVPSMMIALYNVADDVKGSESKISTMTKHANYSSLQSIAFDSDTTPVEVLQARYAIEIAAAAGAERYASADFAIASEKLDSALAALEGKRKERATAVDFAREAVVASEDALRAALLAAEADAAETQRVAAATAAAETERRRAEASAETASAEAVRAELLQRLDAALPTHETDRGLVSEIGGVQFASGRADLGSAAREGLARFSGIVASYPGLHFQVEGHTDNVGDPTGNQTLSYERAIAVRDYLITQGVPASMVDVAGFGPTRPTADNSTAEGRARNRRVEIVIANDSLAAARGGQ